MTLHQHSQSEGTAAVGNSRDNLRAFYDFERANFGVDAKYRVDKVLGKGSYGTVCSAIDIKTNNKIAIKKVSNIFDKEVLLKRAVRELKLMIHFKGHRNIINLIDLDLVYEKPYDGLYCYQSLVENDLTHVIFSGIQFSEFHILSFTYQILCGLKYIHSADVIHRDLKPGNILVNCKGQLQICDFGLARGISQKYTTISSPPITNYVATRWYRAPELILSKTEYSKAVDLWAAGCILGELYGRKPMFMGNNQLHQITEISRILGNPKLEVIKKHNWKLYSPGSAASGSANVHSKPARNGDFNISGPSKNLDMAPRLQYPGIALLKLYPFACENAIDLLENLLCWDPDTRLSVGQALNHSFLAPVRSRENEPSHPHIFDFSFEQPTGDKNHYLKILEEDIEKFKREKRNHYRRSESRPLRAKSKGESEIDLRFDSLASTSRGRSRTSALDAQNLINEPHNHQFVRTFQA